MSKELAFTYKEGFQELPYLLNSPQEMIESYKKMPFIKYNAAKQSISTKMPYLDITVRYREVEEGLFLIYSEAKFKANICFHHVYDKSASNNYYCLSLRIDHYAKTHNSMAGGISYTDNSWLIFKPDAKVDHYHFKGTKGKYFSVFFTLDWLKEHMKQFSGHDSVVTDKAYFWNGNTLTKSGTYTGIFVNKNGCDSVVTLKLTSTYANTGHDSIVTPNASYVWKGDTLKASGTYVDTFVNSKGCDSVVTLKLTLNSTGLAENVSSLINIYPNPSHDVFTVNLGNNLGEVNYTVLSIDGKLMRERNNITDPTTTIDLGAEKQGIYFLKISGHNFIRVFRLMKQ